MAYRDFALLALLASLVTGSLATTASAQASSAPTLTPAPAGQVLSVPAGYGLVWADEFAVDGLPDPARWRYDTQRNREGWYNNERQYYADARLENSRIENGALIIEARAERLSRSRFPDWGRQRYTSARLYTHGIQAWTYGFFEIRAKLPCGVGTWPAFWMLPEDQSEPWPASGEIDIMEHVGHTPGEINQTVHTGAYNHVRGTHRSAKFRVDDACDTMHNYQLLWTPDAIIAGVDGEAKYLFERTDDDRAKWPFDRPMHLLLNVAVGGDWGGQGGIRADAFPARFEIDYVRVYQLPTAMTGQATAAEAGRN